MLAPDRLTPLIAAILEQYRLPHRGVHGVTHWARVYENGARIADENGADGDVIALFAIFHDACRVNDSHDEGHGRRGAELAMQMRTAIPLSDPQFDLFQDACRWHTDGNILADLTIQTCWDADRLDLPRVGIPISKPRLCTPQARRDECILWATERAERQFSPAFVGQYWLHP